MAEVQYRKYRHFGSSLTPLCCEECRKEYSIIPASLSIQLLLLLIIIMPLLRSAHLSIISSFMISSSDSTSDRNAFARHPARDTAISTTITLQSQSPTPYCLSPHYVLHLSSHSAKIHFFDPLMTALSEGTLLPALDNPKCMAYTAKTKNSKLLLCTEKQILCIWNPQAINNETEKSIPVSNKFGKGEHIVYVSDGLQLFQREYHVAYTNQDEFYLISVAHNGLECSKILEEGQGKTSYNPFSWFKSTQKQHREAAHLMLTKLQGEDLIKMVSVLDYTISVHEINPKQSQKPTIRLVSQQNLQEKATATKHFRQLVPICSNRDQEWNKNERYFSFLVVFEQTLTNHISISKVEVTVKQKIAVIKKQIPVKFIAHCFWTIRFKDFFYVTAKNAKKGTYFVYQFQENDFKQNSEVLGTDDSRCLLKENDPIYLVKTDDESALYGITSNGIYSLEKSVESKGLGKQIEENFKSERQKSIQIQNYQRLSSCLQNEYSSFKDKLIEGEMAINKELTEEVVTLFISQQVAQNSAVLEARQKKIFSDVAKDLDVSKIKHLLNSLVQKQLFDVLVYSVVERSVLEFIKTNELNLSTQQSEQFRSVLQELLFEPTSRAISYFISQNLLDKGVNNHYYKALLNSIAEICPQGYLEPSLLIPLVPFHEDVFIRTLILEHRMVDPFIYFFTVTKIDFKGQQYANLISFSHQDLHAFASQMDQKQLKDFIKQIIFKGHEEWIKVKEEADGERQYISLVQQKTTILVRALSEYSQLVTPHLDKTFPGLKPLFYFNFEARRQKAGQIQEIAEKAKCPYTAYLLNLSVTDSRKQNNIALLDTNRLCRQLQTHNHSSEDLIDELKESEGVSVKKEIWQQWTKSHQQSQGDIEVISRKVKVYE